MESVFHQSENFEEMVEHDARLKQFKEKLLEFFKEGDNEFTKLIGNPEKVSYSLLIDPDASTMNPRARITYSKVKSCIDIGKLNAEFVKSFKSYIFKISSSPTEYEVFRKLQRKFVIIFDFTSE